MRANILEAGSDDEFRMRAFKDYVQSKNESYQNFMAALSTAIENCSDEEVFPEELEEVVQNDCDRIFNENLIPSGFNKLDTLCFNEGYITIEDFVKSALRDTYADMNAIDIDTGVTLDLPSGRKVEGIDVFTLIDETKTNLHSSVCLFAACEAMDTAADDVAGRLAVFNDKVKEIFENEYSDLSNTASYLKNNLLKSANVSSFFSSLSVTLNTTELENDYSDFSVSQSDFSKYAGASPMNALASGAAKGLGVVGQAINVGVKVVSSIIKQGANLIGKLFSKATDYASKVFVNPYDVKVIDEKSTSYITDGWTNSLKQGLDLSLPLKTPIRLVFSPGSSSLTEHLSKINAEINGSRGKWFKYSNLGGEYLFRTTQNDLVTSSGLSMATIDLSKVDVYVKPRSINFRVYSQWAAEINSKYTVYNEYDNPFLRIPWTECVNEINRLKQNPNLFSSVPDKEEDQYKAFLAGYWLSAFILTFGCGEADGYNLTYGDSDEVQFCRQMPTDFPAPDVVTNRDFVAILTGARIDGSDFVWDSTSLVPSVDNANHELWKRSIIGALFGLIIFNYQDKLNYPLDFTFIPYRLEKEGWSAPTFAIKTDDENTQAVENLIANVVVIAIVAAIAFSFVCVIKKIQRAAYFSRQKKLSILDNKMWNGASLTAREQKQYARLSRKQGKTSLLNSGLQSSSSSSSADIIQRLNEMSVKLSNLENKIKL